MSRQAIVTKFFGPTDHRGSRIKATAMAGSVTVPYDYSSGFDAMHAKAAKALAEKMGWGGTWVEGGMPDDTGNCYVAIPSADLNADEIAFVTEWREWEGR